MPELPEVETVCRGLNQLTLGHIIQGGEVLLQRTLAYPLSLADFWQGINGSEIITWQRRGKYLLAKLNSGAWLGVHLRMTGQLLWVNRDSNYPKHTRIRLFLGATHELRFVDTRTFGKIWFVPSHTPPETIITGLQKLGPEPFSEMFSLPYLERRLRSIRRPIKAVLLDQEIVAGIGNIYADEALFQSGILPTAIASSLNSLQLEKLRLAVCEVLQTSIDKGGTTFSNFLSVTGVNGNYGGVAWVYGRGGKPCRVCGTTIEKIKLGGRSAHFCPQCQIHRE